jgi:hypothetical protein
MFRGEKKKKEGKPGPESRNWNQKTGREKLVMGVPRSGYQFWGF